MVDGSTEHSPGEAIPYELWRNGQAALLAGDRFAHDDLIPQCVHEKDAAVAAIKQFDHPHGVAVDVQEMQVEPTWRDSVGSVHDGGEDDIILAAVEEAEEGRLPVVEVEAAEELGVGGRAPPLLADRGGPDERGGLPRKTEEDLPQEVVVFNRRGQRCREDSAAADHFSALAGRADLGTGAAASHSGSLLARVKLGMAAGHSDGLVTRVGLGPAAAAAAAVHALFHLGGGGKT